MSEMITIQVDGVDIEAPKGLTVVDAAMRGGVKIPVFCHHPKLEPVGMCRMCLVRVGMPMFDRATKEPILDDNGEQKYNWGRGLQTGCTVRIAPGMRIQSETEEVKDARDDVIEFLLTSHPLDCPICDKGGECPLQNLTMEHGKGESRFYFGDKMHLDKNVPLGDLIYLDRERCIQCARCVRFQDEVVDDPVIAFHNRGRQLEIVTLSDPGFDSIWSGNTTDICPVGALTTADFRFGARAWELVPVASLSPHGPVGENITMSTRREAKSGGKTVIKRVMPRQNEWVNETWIPDIARFAHHYASHEDRIQTPMIRKNGELVEASWDEAILMVAENLMRHQETATGLAGGRLSNEDLFLFQKLFRKVLKNNNVDLAIKKIAGGDVTAEVGITAGTNVRDMGEGDTILVVASDLHAEAPMWWLRIKQAAERGATLITLNGRKTSLDKFAAHAPMVSASALLSTVQGIKESKDEWAKAVGSAENLLVYYGSEGLSYDETDALARLLGNLLLETEKVGKENSGLVTVWPECNTQGAWDVGVTSGFGPGYRAVKDAGLTAEDVYAGKANVAYIAGADPVGAGLMKGKSGIKFLVVQDLFMTETAKLADVVLPRQSWAERDGTWTNGERRVQRYYPAISPVGSAKADWKIFGELINKIDESEKVPFAASLIFAKEVAKGTKPYKGMTYKTLAEVVQQFPIVGGEDLYYGGTSYANTAGIGQQWSAFGEKKAPKPFDVPEISESKTDGVTIVQMSDPFAPSEILEKSDVLAPRLAKPMVFVNSKDAEGMNLESGDAVTVKLQGYQKEAVAHVNGVAPEGTILVNGLQYRGDMESAEIVKS